MSELTKYTIVDPFHGHGAAEYYLAADVEARIAELEERLEMGFGFDSDGNRVVIPKDSLDGICCRDATIAGQDERIRELRQQLAETHAHLDAQRLATYHAVEREHTMKRILR